MDIQTNIIDVFDLIVGFEVNGVVKLNQPRVYAYLSLDLETLIYLLIVPGLNVNETSCKVFVTVMFRVLIHS